MTFQAAPLPLHHFPAVRPDGHDVVAVGHVDDPLEPLLHAEGMAGLREVAVVHHDGVELVAYGEALTCAEVLVAGGGAGVAELADGVRTLAVAQQGVIGIQTGVTGLVVQRGVVAGDNAGGVEGIDMHRTTKPSLWRKSVPLPRTDRQKRLKLSDRGNSAAKSAPTN